VPLGTWPSTVHEPPPSRLSAGLVAVLAREPVEGAERDGSVEPGTTESNVHRRKSDTGLLTRRRAVPDLCELIDGRATWPISPRNANTNARTYDSAACAPPRDGSAS